MLNALLEHLQRKTLCYFFYVSLPCAEYKHLKHTRTADTDFFFLLKPPTPINACKAGFKIAKFGLFVLPFSFFL